jgi:tetratricopeptide (TPR) repeat protein
MKVHCVLVCAVFGLFVAATHTQAAPNYDALIQQGKAQLQAGNSAAALATGQQAIQLNSNRWEAYALAGGALMNLKRYEEAEDDFSHAIDHAPEAKQDGLRALRKQCALAEAGVAPSAATPPVVAPATQPAPTTQAEIVLWKTIEHSTNPDDFKTYLQTYPNGAFAPLAQRQLTALQSMAQQQATAQQRALDQEARDDQQGVWTDRVKGLMWTKKDLGFPEERDLKWQDAVDYCKNLQLADHSDWRLPTIDELAGLYDPQRTQEIRFKRGALSVHVTDKISFATVWYWSGTLSKHSKQAWAFIFTEGVREETALSIPRDVLCTRNVTE